VWGICEGNIPQTLVWGAFLTSLSFLVFTFLSFLAINYWSASWAAPIISNEELVTISDDQIIITCQTTNEPSIGGIKWGLSPNLGNITRESSATNYHYLTLGNLHPNTTYYYKVFCQSSSGTSESAVRSFTTLPRPSGNYLFTFAVLSDLHYAPNLNNTKDIRGRPYNSSEAIVSNLVSAINQFSPDFTIIKGDMIDSGINLSAYPVESSLKPKLDLLTAKGSTKYYVIPGNHDKSASYGGGNWVANNLIVLYPSGPSVAPTSDASFNYSFTYQGYRFIMLDSSTHTGITAEVNISSLEAELNAAKANKQKAFIFMHHEATKEPDIPSGILAAVLNQTTFTEADWDKIRISNYEQFFNKLNEYKLDNGEPVVAGVFMGHIHDNRRRDFYGIPFVRTSSGLQFPTGFNIYKVYSNGYLQSFYKLPGYSEEIARELITGTQEVTK
ncbi:MAG: metallophosphoesterase, partial [Candidatus Margulisiibacteriota bacterium]